MHHVGKVLIWVVGLFLVGLGIYSLFFGPYVVQVLSYEAPSTTIVGMSGAVQLTNQQTLVVWKDLVDFNKQFPALHKNVQIPMTNGGSGSCSVFAYEADFDIGLLDPCPTWAWTSSQVRGLTSAWKMESSITQIMSETGQKKYEVRVARRWWVVRPPPPAALRVEPGQ